MEKKYMRIGEVARIVGLNPRVLRQWENEYPMLKPLRHKGHRYYTKEMVELILRIKSLKEKGMTPEGIRRRLAEGLSDEERGFIDILEGVKGEICQILEFMDACERKRNQEGL